MKVASLALLFIVLAGCARSPATPALSATITQDCTAPGTTSLLFDRQIGNLAVYLPPCHDPTRADPYPLLILLPGRGGSARTWDLATLQALADAAVQAGQVRPLVIALTDEAFDYMSMDTLTGTLLAFMETAYHAGGERALRALGGFSLGGYCAYHTTIERPDLFESAGVFGNGLVAGQEQTVRAQLAAIPAGLEPRLFISSGLDDTYMLSQAQALLPLLDEAGLAHTEVFSPGSHDTTTWWANFPAYLRWLEAGWQ